MKMTEEEYQILDHTINNTAKLRFCGDSVEMQNLIKHGLMTYFGRFPVVPQKYFTVTDAGIKMWFKEFRKRYPKDPLQFVGIDSWNRPIFRSKVRPKMHYGCCEILFSCDATEKEVAEKVTEADILYFGTSFGCEPEGTTPNAIKIEWNDHLDIAKRAGLIENVKKVVNQ